MKYLKKIKQMKKEKFNNQKNIFTRKRNDDKEEKKNFPLCLRFQVEKNPSCRDSFLLKKRISCNKLLKKQSDF